MTVKTRIPQEIEIKLLAPRAAVLTAIARIKNLGPYRLRAWQTVRLHTVYLDTSEFTLARHGVALRLRRTGAQWEASLKWSGQEDGIIHTRPELTVQLSRTPSFPFTLSPGPLAAQLSRLVAGQQLLPILISDVRRRRFGVFFATRTKNPALAELALDHVRLSAPGAARRAATTYCEVEVELKPGGSVQDLLECARLLRERFVLTPAEGSKFSRGLALLYGPGLSGVKRTGQWPVPPKDEQAHKSGTRTHALRRRQRPAARNKASPPITQQ